jgi:hypothetical protein
MWKNTDLFIGAESPRIDASIQNKTSTLYIDCKKANWYLDYAHNRAAGLSYIYMQHMLHMLHIQHLENNAENIRIASDFDP